MIAFLDASAMVAIITGEPEAFSLEKRYGQADAVLCSAMSLWETVRAVARKRKVPVAVAHAEVETFRVDFALRLVPIGETETREAIMAHERYGKGNHPAKLNMGDCFAYACAKAHGAELLYKGNDFAQTDLA
ncbi:type II toxin-antitoxin system VapC family toxin [Sphingomonas sp. LB2R24]|uniref:type II toxin-antitoxin system VapC family toxin n=1 Tax=Sphingomonas sorbitolis TaxID=3096165 RepID=UPI002FCBB022